MNRNLIILGLILVLLVGFVVFAMSGQSIQFGASNKSATIKDQTVKLEIADSQEEREKGLSNRKSLPEDTGLLFVFDKADKYPFWMKDMQFPIDIIFLNNNKIVSIYHDVKPYIGNQSEQVENLILYSPEAPANRVLELNAGQAKKFDLKKGDEITFNL